MFHRLPLWAVGPLALLGMFQADDWAVYVCYVIGVLFTVFVTYPAVREFLR